MAIRYRRKRLYLLLILPAFCLPLTCYILPFAQLRLAAPDVKSQLGEQLVFHMIARKTIDSETTSGEQVIRLLHYVNRHIARPDPDVTAHDVSRLHILEAGEGYCDQQVNVLLALCEAAGMQGRMVWLFGDDPVSGHTVAEVFYDGSWHMFDPFYREWFFSPDGKVASVEDIINRNLQPGRFEMIPPLQQRHYGKLYPPETAPRTPVMAGHHRTAALLFFNTRVFGRCFYRPWLQQCEYYTGLPFMHIPAVTISDK